MYELKIAIRSLFYRKSQYVSLFLVCAFGVAISLASIFVSNGMISAMTNKARIYYGGDLVFMHSFEETLWTNNVEKHISTLKEIFPKDVIFSYRVVQDARKTSLYFEGSQAFLKTINGVDFDREKILFDGLKFIDGGYEDIKNTNGILISAVLAKLLNVKVGDSITFLFENSQDQQDTSELVIKGIFQDTSVFGMYTCYADLDFVRRIYKRDENSVNRFNMIFPGKKPTLEETKKYYDELSKIYNMFPFSDDKEEYLEIQNDVMYEICALVPLSSNLSDVKILQKAMNAIITFVIVILAIIIVTGIGSTYRVLIMKRINEIGIYMAIGMKKKSIAITLLFETLFLLFAGCICACFLSGIFCFVISLFDFSFIPAFELFLVKGNLLPVIDVKRSIAVIIVVILFTLLAVLSSVWKSIRCLPVKALAVTE